MADFVVTFVFQQNNTMIQVKSFCFNSFDENTYVLYDETNECIIIDPGCHLPAEEKEISEFIESKHLNPVRLINTHCHIDHILGNAYISRKYNLELEIHTNEIKVLESSLYVSKMYQIQFNESPAPKKFHPRKRYHKIREFRVDRIVHPWSQSRKFNFL